MARNYSQKRLLEVNRSGSGDYPVILLEISHSGLAAPARVVRDNVELVSNGETFIAMAFEIRLPSDPQGGLPRAVITIDNVGRELMDWLEASGGGQGATCRIMEVLRSEPDVIEWEATMDLSGVTADPMVITGQLSYDDILNRPAVLKKHTPENSPGLF